MYINIFIIYGHIIFKCTKARLSMSWCFWPSSPNRLNDTKKWLSMLINYYASNNN